MDYGEPEDKQWAARYILDPLTAPEPSQETGPGTSFFNPRRSLSLSFKGKEPIRRRHVSYPTPPQSASPTRSSFHQSNPFSPTFRARDRPPSIPPFDWAPAATVLARRKSYDSNSSGENLHTPRSLERSSPSQRLSPDRQLPPQPQDRYPLRVPQKLVRRASERQPLRIPEKLAHQSPERRSPDWSPRSSTIGRSNTVRYPPQTHYTQGSADQLDTGVGLARSPSLASNGLRRSNSINQRYPGDMSHRPLDMIRREIRAADRAPHRRHRGPVTDTIDSLDNSAIGGAYHHGGPYDATLASRNTNKLYSPVEAVKDSNIQALKATPNEFIKDSLTKHVPLQGTATVPPGMIDMGGEVMNYTEGADLMREADAPGGAYKRWDGIPYHPDDLKGKGEPSYTVERDLKNQKRLIRRHQGSQSSSAIEYEMQPQPQPHLSSRKDGGVTVRQRSFSSATDRPGPSFRGNGPMSPTSPTSPNGVSTSTDLRRSNTTGNRFAEGLKRRFGSFRRNKHNTDEA